MSGLFKKFFFAYIGLSLLFLISCNTQAKAERRLTPPRSISEIRLDDIANYSRDDPARAIHLIEVYRIIYGPETVYPEAEHPVTKEFLDKYLAEAIENLKSSQLKAIEEKRWSDAASLARSLSALGVPDDSGGEFELILEYAKEQLENGNTLAAFLAAVEAHELKPLYYEDALYFFEKAVMVNQRRTAAFFLNIIDGIQGENVVNHDYREYALGRDSPTDMIKGVATVIVDRGFRIERGRGIPNVVQGSAFFVDSSGLLITNYHVISSEVDPSYRGFSRLYIRMGDSASPRIPARVVGWDKTMDLALLKVEITPEYVFSVTDDGIIPNVGEPVLAIGSPVGLEKTVTQGIISALGRRFLQIGDVIQIDAAVNSGNSGGPVVDMAGRLVGIVFAGIDQFQGLNFAVPSGRLIAALPAMLAGGRAERPWLGLTINETFFGAEIIYVAPSTPAAEQRFLEGAVIKSINGKEVNAAQGALIPALQDVLFPLKPGELISMELADEDGNLSRRLLRLTSRPDLPLVEAAKMDTRERIVAPLFGLILSPAGGSIFTPSYQVSKVVRGSIAYEAGLSENDPLTIRGFRIVEDMGFALLEINVRKRRMGYLETIMQLPALLDSPDTL